MTDGACIHCGQPAEMCVDCGVLLEVFKAERARVIEECAQVADDESKTSYARDQEIAERIAAKIRALK